jgi:aminoglycoside phosphotransferase (APT) family kinase protein
MVLPALTTLKAIQLAFNRLNLQSDSNPGIAATAQAISAQLEVLCTRELAGHAYVISQLKRMAEILKRFQDYVSDLSDLPKNMHGSVENLKTEIGSAIETQKDLRALEIEMQRIRNRFQEIVSSLTAYDHPNLSQFVRHVLREMILLEEVDPGNFVAEDCQVDKLSERVTDHDDIKIFENYLQARFSDDSIHINKFHMLPGGFGKQTIMFETTGRELQGDFVVRRDMEIHLLQNDCHMVKKEFPLLKAVFERGFTVAEPLWLETDHDLLPGADFIVTRKAEGEPFGDVFGPGGKISELLNRCLAETLARLHAMPPLIEVGALTESFRPDLWNAPLEKCVRHYITSWHKYYLSENPFPYPAIAGLFVWLLNNIPETRAKPVLAHGDYAFNNFVIHRGNVTAVLDWEFAHIGDPAEDLGYIRNTITNPENWERFVEIYIQSGGQEVDEKRIRFFQIWAHARNAATSAIILSKYAAWKVRDINLSALTRFIQKFIRTAYDLIENVESSNTSYKQ